MKTNVSAECPRREVDIRYIHSV